MSWLPLGVTGLSPTTVNAGPASVGLGRARRNRAVGAAEAVGVAETVVVTGAGPVGVGVAEHATDSAATAHRRGDGGGRARHADYLSPPMFSDPSPTGGVPASAWLT